MSNHSLFHRILGNNLLALTTTNFVWFALTFWAILETRSVIITSFIAGTFAVTNMFGALIFGTIVDHTQRKTAMLLSSVITLGAFSLGTVLFFTLPPESFTTASSFLLWLLVAILMIGTVAGNLRLIALSTTVTMLFPSEAEKAKANGLIGAMQGVSFSLTSMLSGLTIGYFGFGVALIIAVIITFVTLLHLVTQTLPTVTLDTHHGSHAARFDFRGTLAIILATPGLAALIAFTTFNNFIGGTFMALMDFYGLSLVSVKIWGTLWSVLSLAMIIGSIYVAKRGVGSKPLRTIMLVNALSWLTCILFPLQPSIIFLACGVVVWLFLFPLAEAAEQTVIQTVVPFKRQGRVFGFGQSVESAVTPITAFLIGPLAQLLFIPFMTTGSGVELIGSWFGTGEARGIALVFMSAGALGLVVTTLAWRSRSYRSLSTHYQDKKVLVSLEPSATTDTPATVI